MSETPSHPRQARMNAPAPPADLWLDTDLDGVIHLGGDLDERSCSHVGSTLLSQLCSCPGAHVLNVEKVRSLSAPAIRLIEVARHLSAAQGARLEVVCGPDAPTWRSLTAAGLGDHLVPEPSRRDDEQAPET